MHLLLKGVNMDNIVFNTVLNDQGNPIAYDVSGEVTSDGERVSLGFSCFYFDRAFDELCYWVNECPTAKVTYTSSELCI